MNYEKPAAILKYDENGYRIKVNLAESIDQMTDTTSTRFIKNLVTVDNNQ
jgi:hypothetical protein